MFHDGAAEHVYVAGFSLVEISLKILKILSLAG